MQPKLIALCGPIGAGKSTAAKILAESFHYRRLPLAGPLKRMLREGLGLTLAHTDGELKEVPCPELMGMTPRHAMQTLGTEWGRKCISSKLWTEAWRREALQWPLVVVDDARFHNEFDLVREMGGIVILITRDGIQRTYSLHSSEADWTDTDLDYVVHNDGTKEDLKSRIALLLRHLSENNAESTPLNSRVGVGLHSN